jgi:hypothetical protein
MAQDFGLRYVSPRSWCWRAADGSWRKSPKWAAKSYLEARQGLSNAKDRNSFLSPIDVALQDTIENFHVDLAGHYDHDEEIRAAVNRFISDLPINPQGT